MQTLQSVQLNDGKLKSALEAKPGAGLHTALECVEPDSDAAPLQACVQVMRGRLTIRESPDL